jgi:hypothetical protein
MRRAHGVSEQLESIRISVGVTSTEREALTTAASRAGLSLSRFLVRAAMAQIETDDNTRRRGENSIVVVSPQLAADMRREDGLVGLLENLFVVGTGTSKVGVYPPGSVVPVLAPSAIVVEQVSPDEVSVDVVDGDRYVTGDYNEAALLVASLIDPE